MHQKNEKEIVMKKKKKPYLRFDVISYECGGIVERMWLVYKGCVRVWSGGFCCFPQISVVSAKT
jgi:hypothetical protein